MEINKKKELEAKLRQMVAQSIQQPLEKPSIKIQSGAGNIIRRRKGAPDKRIE